MASETLYDQLNRKNFICAILNPRSREISRANLPKINFVLFWTRLNFIRRIIWSWRSAGAGQEAGFEECTAHILLMQKANEFSEAVGAFDGRARFSGFAVIIFAKSHSGAVNLRRFPTAILIRLSTCHQRAVSHFPPFFSTAPDKSTGFTGIRKGKPLSDDLFELDSGRKGGNDVNRISITFRKTQC